MICQPSYLAFKNSIKLCSSQKMSAWKAASSVADSTRQEEARPDPAPTWLHAIVFAHVLCVPFIHMCLICHVHASVRIFFVHLVRKELLLMFSWRRLRHCLRNGIHTQSFGARLLLLLF